MEQTLSPKEWKERKKAHEDALGSFISEFRERRRRGASHPVHDFLFTYYTFPPGRLEKWHPGHGITLAYESENDALEWIGHPQYRVEDRRIFLNLALLKERDLRHLTFIHKLCCNIQNRPQRFSCFGLHEWAMVYKTEDIRHSTPLRLSHLEIQRVVEQAPLCCSHFDAFRFFTPQAAPLNVLQPTAEGRLEFEQGGCLHANMDLYKWAFKLSPWISSELLREAFFLALRARELDMRASPYDFEALGFQSVRIETQEGRDEYQVEQRRIAEHASLVRAKLIAEIERIQGACAQ